ncbi:MAG: HAMP domain-containing histidine kinase [Deltaproteobacteria bacterium]|nr:MAG: HAMP domain-containing histidine kinase [Deltaproteobacteria bacterium]
MDKQVAEIKFFIHDLRVEKFFHRLIAIHKRLIAAYEEEGLGDVRDRHQAYLDRLTTAQEKGRAARETYEVAVKGFAGDDLVVEYGRAYIEATLDTCRIALLPHWRDFKDFVSHLPQGAQARALENSFNESKTWIGAIDRRIVDFVRYTDGEGPMMPMAVHTRVESFVEEHLRYYVRGASDKRLDVRLGDLDRCQIYADRAAFNRVLFNLTMNAVDAMRHKRSGVISFDVIAAPTVVRVVVTDEGQGMSAEKVDQILHSDRDLTGELHSLGFVFVRKVVAQLNGKIDVHSEEGVGTRITLSFPRYLAEKELPSTAPVDLELAEEAPEEVVAGVAEADRAGEIIVDEFCKCLAPTPGCLFSIAIEPSGRVDHFMHKAYDPDWMMGHDDLAPMIYEAVVRGRYEADDVDGVSLILKTPLKHDEYWELREMPREERKPEPTRRRIHDELVRIGRHLITTGMDPDTPVHLTQKDYLFGHFEQSFSADPFPLQELADHPLVGGVSGAGGG